MKKLKLYLNEENCQLLAEDLQIADSFCTRAKGLIGKKEIRLEEVLWIQNCTHIHTLFMSVAIDLIFVNKDLIVQKVFSNAQPWKHLFLGNWRSQSVFELKKGFLDIHPIRVGDQLYVGP